MFYGPYQIQARINQNPEISRQFSLWNQMGSKVILGNLLVIPIEDSLLYVEPLYIRAENGQLPELQRVIASYSDRVVMGDTLDLTLAALFQNAAAASADDRQGDRKRVGAAVIAQGGTSPPAKPTCRARSNTIVARSTRSARATGLPSAPR